MYEIQEDLERRHASFNQLPLLVSYFETLFEEDIEDRKLIIKIISMVCLYRRLPFEALANLFLHEPSQQIADIAMGLVNARWLGWDPKREHFVTYPLPKKLEAQVFSKRYPMPMVCKPNELTYETQSPYLTEESCNPVLVEYNDQRTNLETLNALNQIPLRLNHKVIEAGLDLLDRGTDPKFRKDSLETFETLGDDPFWLTWQFDFRGRVYARGYTVNTQGDDLHKHMVQFAE